jgi:hypothetical protein
LGSSRPEQEEEEEEARPPHVNVHMQQRDLEQQSSNELATWKAD